MDARAPDRPEVWRWYVAYCLAWALFYGLAVGFILFLAFGPGVPRAEPLEGDAVALAILFAGLCAMLALAYAVAPLFPRRPWAWIYGIVVIGFSALGGCFFLAIPLLYFWVKPETRAYFGGPPPTAPVPPAPVSEDLPTTRLELGTAARGRPKVWPWYVGLCVVSGLLYLAIGLVGVASFFDPELAGDPVEDAALAVMGLLLFPICAFGAFVPRRPWGWSYGMAAIVLAMLTCCTLPAAIPIFVFWLKPETKAAFGRR